MSDQFQWVQDLWTHLTDSRHYPLLQVFTLIEGDYLLRDGYAYGLARASLYPHRQSVQYRFMPINSAGETSIPDDAGFLFVGRPRLFAGGGLGRFAGCLEPRGRYDDHSSGTASEVIRYGNRLFQQGTTQTEVGGYSRYTRDLGVLAIHALREENRDAPRPLAAIAGLGSLGTLLLMMLLAQRSLRLRLAAEATRIAPTFKKGSYRNYTHLELCVAVDIGDQRRLNAVLNSQEELNEKAGTHLDAEPAFLFNVEAVVADDEIYLRDARIQLIVTPTHNSRRKPWRLLLQDHPSKQIYLSHREAAILQGLSQGDEGCTQEELQSAIAQVRGDSPRRRPSVYVSELNRRFLGEIARPMSLAQSNLIVRDDQDRYSLRGFRVRWEHL